MREMLWLGALLLLITFLLTVIAEFFLIPWLRKRRAGQPILEIGPAWHLTKAGTPTLGGLGFIAAILLGACVCTPLALRFDAGAWGKMILLVSFSLLCGAIGFFDDWCKLKKRENKGLSALQKYLLQFLVSAAFLVLSVRLFGVDTALSLPFVNKEIQLGVFYYPFALLYLTGIVNALNLTDGVDGLLSSTTAAFALFLVACGMVDGDGAAMATGALLLGATLGFLCFNRHPAKVFMGDTGSLFLGAMVGGYGILSPAPLATLLGCGVFVTEALSVIAQVLYFKATGGKRLFRMSPLHHHFEKGGWSETRVVCVFSLAGIAFAALAFWGR